MWGKQSLEDNTTNGKTVSTKQLMNQDKLVRGRTRQASEIRSDEEERYKLLCEINTFKRRAERNEKKLVRIFMIL